MLFVFITKISVSP